jgi:chemotaxis protein CheX
MKAEYIKAFINATLFVFEKTDSVRAEAGRPYFEKNDAAQGDVSSIIGFTGHVNGTFSISFKDPLLLRISSHILGREIKDINDEVIHVVTKLTHLIANQARQGFEQMGKVVEFATPTTFSGNHTIASMSKNSRTSVPFKTDADNFTIRICLVP